MGRPKILIYSFHFAFRHCWLHLA